MPGQWAGPPIAVYAQVHCREPKTGQQKVELYCEDDLPCQSGYNLSMSLDNTIVTIDKKKLIQCSAWRLKMFISYVMLKYISMVFLSLCSPLLPCIPCIVYYIHRRMIYKEAKANCRSCFLGENGHPQSHMLLLSLCYNYKAGRSKLRGGVYVYYIFYNRSNGFLSNIVRHSSK